MLGNCWCSFHSSFSKYFLNRNLVNCSCHSFETNSSIGPKSRILCRNNCIDNMWWNFVKFDLFSVFFKKFVKRFTISVCTNWTLWEQRQIFQFLCWNIWKRFYDLEIQPSNNNWNNSQHCKKRVYNCFFPYSSKFSMFFFETFDCDCCWWFIHYNNKQVKRNRLKVIIVKKIQKKEFFSRETEKH